MIDDDPLALPVLGEKEKLGRATWVKLGEYARLGPKVIDSTLGELARAADDAVALVERSALPEEMKESYAALLRERSAVLGRA